MNDPTYINRLKKTLRNPRIKLYQKVAGGLLIMLGILMIGNMSWAFYKIEQLNKTENECIALMSDDDVSTEDLTNLSIALHELTTVRIKLNNYTSSLYSMCAGAFVGFGIMVFLGSVLKRHETIIALWERVELLEKQVELHGPNTRANQKLDPTVKTPAESGNEQGTAGQL